MPTYALTQYHCTTSCRLFAHYWFPSIPLISLTKPMSGDTIAEAKYMSLYLCECVYPDCCKESVSNIMSLSSLNYNYFLCQAKSNKSACCIIRKPRYIFKPIKATRNSKIVKDLVLHNLVMVQFLNICWAQFEWIDLCGMEEVCVKK